jgi:hypothetical protein
MPELPYHDGQTTGRAKLEGKIRQKGDRNRKWKACGQKTVDEKYLKFMITNPDVWVVKDVPPIIPHVPLTGAELDVLVKYIKSLEG